MSCPINAVKATEMYGCLKEVIVTDSKLDYLFKSPFDSDHEIYQDTTVITLADLTNKTETFEGTGVFDVVMNSVKLHIREEYDKNRMSGAEYASTYVSLTESALSNSVQFLLNKDKAKWEAIAAQIAAIKANADLAKARVEYEKVLVEKAIAETELAAGKLNLLAIEANIDNINMNTTRTEVGIRADEVGILKDEFELNNIFPKQAELLECQVETCQLSKIGTGLDNDKKQFEIDYILEKQKDLLQSQIDTGTLGLVATQANIDRIRYEIDFLLNKQNELLKAQISKEYATTKDEPVTWSGESISFGGGEVGGVIGKQKGIYEQQEKSFKQDTINGTINQLHSTWAAAVTNALDAPVPSKVAKYSFQQVIDDQFAALASNTNYANNVPTIPDPPADP